MCGLFHRQEAVLPKGPHGVEAILPANLLAFEDAAGVVADGDFVNLVAEPADLCCDFRAELKAEAAEAHGAQDVDVEGFVGGCFVGDGGREQNVGCGGEKFVGQPVGELHALKVAHETTAVDHCGLAIDDGLEHLDVIVGIVFEVTVLDEDDVAGGFADADADGCAFAEVLDGMMDGDEAGVAVEDLGGAVGRPIIDDHDFFIAADGQRGFHDAVEHHRDHVDLVVDRDDDGDLHVCC